MTDSPEEVVSELEKLFSYLKMSRQNYLNKSSDITTYSAQTEKILRLMRERLNIYQRLFLPYHIPENLRLSVSIPKWFHFSQDLSQKYKEIQIEYERKLQGISLKYGRPGVRRSIASKAAYIQSQNQEILFSSFQLKITRILSDFVVNSTRISPKDVELDQTLHSQFFDYITLNELSAPDSETDAKLFVMQVFQKGGPFETYAKQHSAQQSLDQLCSQLLFFFNGQFANVVPEFVLEELGSYYYQPTLQFFSENLTGIVNRFEQSFSLFGDDLSLADFGFSGKIDNSFFQNSNLFELAKKYSQLLEYVSLICKDALNASVNFFEAAARIAVLIVKQKIKKIPIYIFTVFRFCSFETLYDAQISDLFVQAFDLIFSYTTDLESNF